MTDIEHCTKQNPCERPCLGATQGCPYVAVNDAVCDVPYATAREVRSLRQQIQGAVAERDDLRLMLGRLLDVALVDGYGETVADEARALLGEAVA